MLSRMISVLICLIVLTGIQPTSAMDKTEPEAGSGNILVRSAHSMTETIALLKQAIESRGIMLFSVIDQSELAAKTGATVGPSTLLVFGNPRLGARFIEANPYAALDWPVRLLVRQDRQGIVWVAYADFNEIARRYRIEVNKDAFDTASQVVASIISGLQ